MFTFRMVKVDINTQNKTQFLVMDKIRQQNSLIMRKIEKEICSRRRKE